MIIGLRYWIWIWYGILALGVLGLASALYWGGRTGWKNLDEILRATGTIAVSTGMVLLLRRDSSGAGQVLLIAALFSFVMAFVLGRKIEDRRPPDEGEAPD